MPMQLQGGENGTIMEVDSKGRAQVLALTHTNDYETNLVNGKYWSIPWENITNAGANDYVIYIKNTGSADLAITDIRMSSDTATQVEVHVVTGTAGGSPTDITPVSRNLGSSETPTATIQSDPDITGLTSGGTLFFMQIPVANTQYHLKTSSNIIIPKNKAVAVLIETTTCATTGVISLTEIV